MTWPNGKAWLTDAPLVPIGRTFFALALLGLGAEHFVYGEFVTGRAPGWPAGVPGKLVWVYASGVLVMLTGLAILVGRVGDDESAVIPSEAAERRSRGIAGVWIEGPLYRDDCDSSLRRLRSSGQANAEPVGASTRNDGGRYHQLGFISLCRRWGRSAALGLGVIVFGWAFLRHLPVVAADSLFGGSWTRAGKALTIFGGLFAVAATLPALAGPATQRWRRFVNGTDSFVRLGQVCLAGFLIVSGIQHFKFIEFVVTLIPAWIPGDAIWWGRLAGVALIAGGVGLLFRRTAARAAPGIGLMIFSWFWIVHLPRVRVSVSDGIALFEALAVSGIALVVSGERTQLRLSGNLTDSRASYGRVTRDSHLAAPAVAGKRDDPHSLPLD